MPANLIHHLYRRSRQAQHLTQCGFTLLELLVAILIGGIITSGLLFLVIEMLQVNNREERLTQAQQDMRRALDYIASDVGEAVFVYSDFTTAYNLLAQLDDEPVGATPVLAFWRLDPLSDQEITDLDNCDSQPPANTDECEALLVRQNTYTLVVYFHQTNDNADIWEGQSRIIRYELPAYDEISNNTLTRNRGYADPTVFIPGLATNTFNTFATWRKATGETTDGNTAVLTDFVNVVNNGNASTPCPDTTFARTPAAGTGFNSFYTCVAQPDAGVANSQNLNKSLIVYLQGNAAQLGRNQVVGLTESSSLPTLESQVLIRGVIQNAP